MALKKEISFTKSFEVVHCLPTLKHCMKGPKASASINTLDVLAIDQGVKTKVEVYYQFEKKLYVFDAKKIIKLLYQCGSSDFMAFMYKAIKPLEIR